MSFLIDTHAHLDFPELYDRLDEILKSAKENNVLKVISISTNMNKIQKIINLSHKYSEIFFSVGVHPNEVLKDENFSNYNMIYDISKDLKCVGIGECGLDYHFGNENKTMQKISFITQINVARDTNLPLIIHSRDADDDMISILQSEYIKGAFKAILHCFSSTERLARCGIDLGFYISFSGIVTFKSAKTIQDIALFIPNDKILIETDAPYLSPSPLRGTVNEPKNCYYIAKFLSDLKENCFENFSQQLYRNSIKVFDKLL